MKLDDIEEKFGGISRYQIFVIVMTATAVFGTSSMSQSAIFFSAVPDHRCAIPQIDNLTLLHSNTTEHNISSLFIPPGDSCHRYNYNLSVCDEHGDLSCVTNQTKVEKIKCDNGYVYDKTHFKSTTVSEASFLWHNLVENTINSSISCCDSPSRSKEFKYKLRIYKQHCPNFVMITRIFLSIINTYSIW
uniref:solute carrier family 22 member 12-like n=1 Tax=Styela clava TaxID=7725 RepID=UPI00193937B0|nr:solute carrier family 22 member 12-like [Styela clava]